MRKIGETPSMFWPQATCQHNGRVFYFFASGGKLAMTEAILSDKAEFASVETGVKFYSCSEDYITCCLFGQSILVMGSDRANYSALLVSVDEGRLSESAIHVTSLAVNWDEVNGNREWPRHAFLCQVTENRALLNDWRTLWYCDITEASLTIRKCSTSIPANESFRTAPIRLWNGKLLVVKSGQATTDIILITAGEEPTFEKVGSIPEKEVHYASMVLVKDRFAVIFEGQYGNTADRLWVFDLQTRKLFEVVLKDGFCFKNGGELLVLLRDELYFLAYTSHFKTVSSVSLLFLLRAIPDMDTQLAFRSALDIRLKPVMLSCSPAHPGMQRLGTAPDFRSFNTIQHDGRILSLSPCGSNVVVMEALLGERVDVATVALGSELGGRSIQTLGCCPLAADILVVMLLAPSETDGTCEFLTGLMQINEGGLGSGSARLKTLQVGDRVTRPGRPYLVSLSDEQAWLSFSGNESVWTITVRSGSVFLENAGYSLPPGGLRSLPVRHSDGRLLVAGPWGDSNSISAVTLGEDCTATVLGSVPVDLRHGTVFIPFANRFLVGFGGDASSCLWVFDLETGRASLVEERGEWPHLSQDSALLIRDSVFYVLGPDMAFGIPLGVIAGLIHDSNLRSAVCSALALPAAPPSPPSERGMELIEKVDADIRSNNTVQRQGRLFHVHSDDESLLLTEYLVEKSVIRLSVRLDVGARPVPKTLACCSLGNSLLVMGVLDGSKQVFAALVRVAAGPLLLRSVRVVRLAMEWKWVWGDLPYLCQVSDSRVLLFFSDGDSQNYEYHDGRYPLRRCNLWYCDLAGSSLNPILLKTIMPKWNGFATVPLRLPCGKLLVAGSYPDTAAITLISPGDEPFFESTGVISGGARKWASCALILERFVVGFAGQRGSEQHSRYNDSRPDYLDDLWLFDTKTRESSRVRKAGAWHPGGRLVAAVVQNDSVYLLGGEDKCFVSRISFLDLADLLENVVVKADFRLACGFPIYSHTALVPPTPGPKLGMVRLNVSTHFRAFNTVRCRSRVLALSPCGHNLLVSELFPGRGITCAPAELERRPGPGRVLRVGCCGAREGVVLVLLVVGPEAAQEAPGSWEFWLALWRVGNESLSPEGVRLECLRSGARLGCPSAPCTASMGEGKVWFTFPGNEEAWIAEARGESVFLTRSDLVLPSGCRACLSPVTLPDGRLVFTGCWGGVPGVAFVSLPVEAARDGPGVIAKHDVARVAGDCPGKAREVPWEFVAELPFASHSGVVLTAVDSRFLLVLGGPTAELWVVDLETRRSSLIWERGDWCPKDRDSAMVLSDGVLYVFGEKAVSAVALSAVARLIHDSEVRAAFCVAISFPELPACVESRNRGEVYKTTLKADVRGIRFGNATVHQGRLLYISSQRERLALTEVLLGRAVKQVRTSLDIGSTAPVRRVCCCSMGDDLLVLGRTRGKKHFAALLRIGKGVLCRASIQCTCLDVEGGGPWGVWPLLYRVADGLALLRFRDGEGAWLCEVESEKVRLTGLPEDAPAARAFRGPVASLSGERLLAAETHGSALRLSLLPLTTAHGEGDARQFLSGDLRTALVVPIGKRFAVGVSIDVRESAILRSYSYGYCLGRLGGIHLFDSATGRSFLRKYAQ